MNINNFSDVVFLGSLGSGGKYLRLNGGTASRSAATTGFTHTGNWIFSMDIKFSAADLASSAGYLFSVFNNNVQKITILYGFIANTLELYRFNPANTTNRIPFPPLVADTPYSLRAESIGNNVQVYVNNVAYGSPIFFPLEMISTVDDIIFGALDITNSYPHSGSIKNVRLYSPTSTFFYYPFSLDAKDNANTNDLTLFGSAVIQ